MTIGDFIKVFAPEYGFIYLEDEQGSTYWYTALENGISLAELCAKPIRQITAKSYNTVVLTVDSVWGR